MFYLCFWLALVVSMLPSNVEDAQYVWGFLTLMATRQAYTLRLFGFGAQTDAEGRIRTHQGQASGSRPVTP